MLTAAIIAFFAVVLFIGLWGRHPQETFFLAGRHAGTLTVASSLLATCLGSSAIIGIVGKAYERGWPAFWWLGAGSIGLALLGTTWSRCMREDVNVRTLPEWAGLTYGAPARTLSAILIVLMWVGVVAAQFVAAGAVLAGLAGWPVLTGIAVTATVTIIYTSVGGQQSVLRTDVLQVVMILCAIVLPLAFLHQLPVTGTAVRTVAAAANSDITAFHWLALVIVVGGMYVVGPDMCSRALVARDDRAAKYGAWLAAGGLLIASLIVTTLGVAARNSGLELTTAREALPALVNTTMPRYLAAAVSFGLLAALFSSADTCLMTAGSVLELDLIARLRIPGQSPARAKVMIAIIGALSAVLAHVNPRIIGNIMLAYSVYAGGLLVPLLLLAAPRFARRIPKPVVWLAMLVGGGAPLALLLAGRIRTADFFLSLASAGAIGAAICLAIIIAGLIFGKRM